MIKAQVTITKARIGYTWMIELTDYGDDLLIGMTMTAPGTYGWCWTLDRAESRAKARVERILDRRRRAAERSAQAARFDWPGSE